MTTLISDVGDDVFIPILTSSGGDVHLTAERYDKIVGNPHGTTLDYAVEARIAKLDQNTADEVSSKLRTLLIVRLYRLIQMIDTELTLNIGELRPSELAKTHASLVGSFSSLTAPATKITFDHERELKEIAAELDIPLENVEGRFKEMETRLKRVK